MPRRVAWLTKVLPVLVGVQFLAIDVHAAAPSTPPGLTAFAGVTWASDYRFNGTSNSAGHPIVQGFVHVVAPRVMYAGLFASQVDFEDPNDTSAELDIYAGRAFQTKDTELRLELMYLAFDESVPGPTYDFWQVKAAVHKSVGLSQIGARFVYTPEAPYGSGPQAQFVVEGSWRFQNNWSLFASGGHGFAANANDRNYGEIGIEWNWRHIRATVRWAASDVPRARCLSRQGCDAAFIVSISLLSWRTN